jgi:hypothetical protein
MKSPVQFRRAAPQLLRTIAVAIPCAMLCLFVEVSSAISLKGSCITLGKGFQDLEQNDHFIVAQGLRLHVYDLGTPGLSFHTYVQYYGDTSTKVSDSGTFRFYHGYFQYSQAKKPVSLKLGRFFLFRGVALGVLDGGEISYKLNRQWEITGFGGLQGNLSREWDFTNADKSPMYGGELRWRPKHVPYLRLPLLSVSYTHQERSSETVRELIGVYFSFKLGCNWRSLNVVQLRPSGGPLRKALTRWNYYQERWKLDLEAAIFEPDVAAYSWFANFMEGTAQRFRVSGEYYFVPNKWGVGASGMFFGNDKYGVRGGPIIIVPYGRIGYNFSGGDQATQNIWWGYFRISPVSAVDLYASAANIEYEWDALDVGTQEITMIMVGTTLRPPFLKTTEWRAEWQNYKTPQLNADRRIIVGLRWNFGY